MKMYEAPHAQIVSFVNDYVATAPGDEASPAGLGYVIAGTCGWSTGDHAWTGCGSYNPNRPAS